MNLNIFLVPDSAACMIFLHHGRDNFWAFPPFLRASEGDRFGMFARAHEKLEPPKAIRSVQLCTSIQSQNSELRQQS